MPGLPLNGRVTELCYVALGSNLGDRSGYLASARAAISLLPDTGIVAASRVEETVPLGARAQPAYLNQMLALRTGLSPQALLDRLHDIERRLGRIRSVRWGSRTIDLDIVRYGKVQLTSAELTVPHPGLRDREFWQREVAELDALVGAQ
jgi:2-amino-4-hydroxy-6-hydroxymethyldihydropteridine diphosphokinase